MTLVQAWIDSLLLLKPKNIQLFVLVTLKSIVDVYKVLVKYWWWLFVIIVVCFIAPNNWSDSLMGYLLLQEISHWSYQILLFATLVATRPSLAQKNCSYFRAYMPYFLVAIPFLFILPLWAWPTGLSPIYFFTILFFLDSPKKVNDLFPSFFRAIKMLIYNYPLLLILGLLIYMPIYIFVYYVSISALLPYVEFSRMLALLNSIKAILLPITVCLYTNIYIKKVHDQFDLYFKQPR